MIMQRLEGKRFVFLVAEGYEDRECWFPKTRLEEEGAEIVVASYEPGTYGSKHGYPIEATAVASEVSVDEFDGVVIPGGASSPDKLRRYESVTNLVKQFDDQGKIVASICHAGWVLISAGIVNGREITSYFAIKDDIVNAGGNYKDKSVVVDNNLISSRHPGDLPDFARAIMEAAF